MNVPQMKKRKQPSLPKIRNVPSFMTTDNFNRSPNISILSNKHDRSDRPNEQSKYRPPSSHTLLLQSNADGSKSLDLPEFFGSNVSNRRVKQLLNEGLKELQVCNIDAAFPLLEQYLLDQLEEKGRDSMSFSSDFTNLMTQVQQQAMQFLNQRSTQEFSVVVLLWAEEQTHHEDIPIQKIKVLNNLGCAYRRTGKLQLAFNSMEQAMQIIDENPQVPNKTMTYLNLTTVLSQMGVHDKALKWARQGLKEAQSEISAVLKGKEDKSSYLEKCRYLGISMYNVAAELEAIGNLDESIIQYKKAYEFIKEQLGQQDPLYTRFHESYNRAKFKLQNNIHFSQEKLKNQYQKGKTNQYQATQKQIHTALFGNPQNGYQTDESITLQTPPQQRKGLKAQLNNNFIVADSEEKDKEKPQQPLQMKPKTKRESSQVATTNSMFLQNGPKTDIEQIGVLAWTDSDSEDDEKKKEAKQPTQQPPIEFETNKEGRLDFLSKMDVFEKEEAAQRREEEKIIQEVENDLQNTSRIIQGQLIRQQQQQQQQSQQQSQQQQQEKEQQQQQQQQEQEQRKKVKLSDDDKIRKFQIFIRRKLKQIKQRRKTSAIIKKFKLKRYPAKDLKIIIVQKETRKKQVKWRAMAKLQKNINRGFVQLRETITEIIEVDENELEIIKTDVPLQMRLYKFKFQIQSPDHLIVKFSMKPYDRKLRQQTNLSYELSMEVGDFLFNLGMIGSYIEEMELTVLEENQQLYNLKAIYQLSRQYLQVIAQGNMLKLLTQYDSNKELENGLKKIAPYLQNLVRIKQNQMKIYGITDFDYAAAAIIQDVEDNQVKIPFYLEPTISDFKMKKIIKIQNFIRRSLAQKKYPQLRFKHRKIQSKLSLITHDNVHITVMKCLDTRDGRKFIMVHMVKDKKNTNDLTIKAIVFKWMGMYTATNFFDIFLVDTKLGELSYSDEAQYWVQEKKGGNLRQKKSMTGQMFQQQAKKIQKCIRGYLYKRDARIKFVHLQRKMGSHNPEQTLKILMKRAAIQEDQNTHNKSAYLQNFILYTDKIQRVSAQGKVHQGFQQSIKITAKTLEHLYSLDHVSPFIQKLFYIVETSELLSIAAYMIENCRVIRGKQNVLKVDCIPLEQVQGILINKQREQGGVEIKARKDETLNPRRRLNQGQFRIRYTTQSQSSVHFTDNDSFRSEFNFNDKKSEYRQYDNNFNYIKLIQSKVKTFYKQRNQKVKEAKKNVNEKDEQSIKNYIKNFMNASDYSSRNLSEIKLEQDKIEMLVRQRQKSIIDKETKERNQSQKINNVLKSLGKGQQSILGSAQIIFQQNTMISSELVHLSLYLNIELFQVICFAIRNDESQMKTVVSKNSLLNASDVNHDFLQTRVEDFIVRQLNIEENVLFFKPIKTIQNILMKDQVEFEKEKIKEQAINEKKVIEPTKLEFDSSKRTIESLLLNHISAVEINYLSHPQGFDIEYVYCYSNLKIFITIYCQRDFKLRKVISFPSSIFACRYINEEINNNSPETIIRFFRYMTLEVSQSLLISILICGDGSQVILTNWSQVRDRMPVILRTKFTQMIQQRIAIRRLVGQFRQLIDYRYSEIHLLEVAECYDLHYVQVLYRLIKKTEHIMIIIKELNTIDESGDILENLRKPRPNAYGELPKRKLQMRYKKILIDLKSMRENYDSYTIIENLSRQQQRKFMRFDYKKLTSHQQTNPSQQYYKDLYKPFLDIIQENLRVSFPGGMMQVRLLNLNLPYEEVEQQKKKLKKVSEEDGYLTRLMMAALKVQQQYKRITLKDWYIQMKQKKKERVEKQRQTGQFVKRRFMKIEQEWFIVNVYRKPDKRLHYHIFTYEVIKYDCSKKQRIDLKNRLRGQFCWDPTMMLNIGQDSLFDYIMDLIYIDEDSNIIKFRDSQYQELQSQQPTLSQGHNLKITEDQVLFEAEEEEPDRLVHHQTQEGSNGKILLYNVVYTGKKALRNKRMNQQQEQEDKSTNKNTLKIEVNLQELRKLYPTLNTKNAKIMKIIGQNLTDGIKIKEGIIVVDKTKITPSFLTISENNIDIDQQQPSNLTQSKVIPSLKRPITFKQQTLTEATLEKKIKPTVKEILVKKTTLYSGSKYLIIISYLERRITKILHSSKDQVFEDFESIYQVQASNLKNKQEPQLLWDLSIDVAVILSHQKNKTSIGHALSIRLQVINKRFIFLADCEQDILSVHIDNQNVILYVEKNIKPVQVRFKNRSFNKNYANFRKTRDNYRLLDGQTVTIAFYKVSKLNSVRNNFITLMLEDENKAIRFFAWSLIDFKIYKLEIIKTKYLLMFLESKVICMISLANYIEFNAETEQVTFTYPNTDIVQDRFDEEKGKNIMKQSQQLFDNNQSKNQNQSANQTVQDVKVQDFVSTSVVEQQNIIRYDNNNNQSELQIGYNSAIQEQNSVALLEQTTLREQTSF